MALAKSLRFDKDMMHVNFMDGRILSVPLMWFPRLRAATPKQRKAYEIAGGGISMHWPELDEDEVSAKRQRLENVGAAPDSAIQHHRHAVGLG